MLDGVERYLLFETATEAEFKVCKLEISLSGTGNIS
jgi:hypothetical protein